VVVTIGAGSFGSTSFALRLQIILFGAMKKLTEHSLLSLLDVFDDGCRFSSRKNRAADESASRRPFLNQLARII
jgi:hypothetical protein